MFIHWTLVYKAIRKHGNKGKDYAQWLLANADKPMNVVYGATVKTSSSLPHIWLFSIFTKRSESYPLPPSFNLDKSEDDLYAAFQYWCYLSQNGLLSCFGLFFIFWLCPLPPSLCSCPKLIYNFILDLHKGYPPRPIFQIIVWFFFFFPGGIPY